MFSKIKSPNLEHLRSFHEVCTAGSVGAAMTKTGIPRATLSRHIASLEDDLSSTLFMRTGQGFILTDLGKTVLDYADNIFQVAADLSEAVLASNAQLAGPIKILASSGIASIIMPSIIADINFASDDLALEIIPMNSISMDRKQDADISIQTHRPIRNDLIVSKVGEIKYGIYASVEYLEKRGIPQSVLDLKEHCFVGTISPILKQKIDGLWGQEVTAHINIIRCEDYPLIWQLVVAGCGIGVTHRAHGDSNPSVKRILPELQTLTLPVWLVAQPYMKERSRLKNVYGLLAKKMRSTLKVYNI